MRTSRFGLVLALLAVTAVTVMADVRYVDANKAGSGNTGMDWDNAWTNLQTALAGAASGTDLWIAKGTYYPGSARTDTFTMRSGVNLYGGFTNGMTSLGQRDWLEHPAILSGDIDKNGILDANNSYHVVTVSGTLSPMPVLDGVQIWHGYANAANPNDRGGGLYCTTNNLNLRNMVFTRNYATNGAALCISGANLNASNCLFAANSGPATSYTAYINGTNAVLRNSLFLQNATSSTVYNEQKLGLQLLNCTFLANNGTQIRHRLTCNTLLKNSIIWESGSAALVTSANGPLFVHYSDVTGYGGSTNWLLSAQVEDWGGNIDTDPKFVGGPTGTWTADDSYDSGTDRTTLTDSGASFTDGALRGKFLNPDTAGKYWHYIITNTANGVVVAGSVNPAAYTGKAYRIFDAHLQSTNGHWTASGTWVADAQHSPCIDAGDPGDAYAGEPSPNGNRLNMGAYGNTAQASTADDTQAPDPVGILVALAGNNQVQLKWFNPPNRDLAGVLVLRRTGSAPTGIPNGGTTYSIGNAMGDCTVVYTGTGSSGTPGAASAWTDSTAANGTHYYYAVFSYDGGPRYATGTGVDTTPTAIAGASPIYVDANATGGNNGTTWADAYTDLQAAIGAAGSGTRIWVAQGRYTPGTQRQYSFEPGGGVEMYGGMTNGMASLDLRNTYEHPTILSGNIGLPGYPGDNSYHVVKCAAAGVLDGFQIRDGYASMLDNDSGRGGGLYSTAAGQIIRNCVFTGNYALYFGSAIYVASVSDTLISNCLFTAQTGLHVASFIGANNTQVKNSVFLENGCTYSLYNYSGGAAGTTAANCTFAGNSGIQVHQVFGSRTVHLRDSIVWGNTNTITAGTQGNLSIYNSDVQGAPYGGAIADQGGNIDADPLFAGGPAPTGTWTHAPVFNAGSGRTTLTDSSASFTDDALRGKHLNADSSGRNWHYIVSNSATQIVVAGDASTVGLSTKNYRIWDLHLQSTSGRWTAGGNWGTDAQNSPCIDAGDPLADFNREPAPNGARLNMGAYGNTEQASKSLASAPDPVEALLAIAGNAEVRLAWENPLSASMAGVLILRKDGSSPGSSPAGGQTYITGDSIGDGTVVYAGTGADGTPGAANQWTDTASVVNGTHHYYQIFVYDAARQYSTGKGTDTTPSALAGVSPLLVDAGATGGNNGDSWANAYTSLRAALAAATNGMQVWIAQGTYKPGDRRADTFVAGSGVQVLGGFTNGMTSVDARDWTEYPSVLSGNIGEPGTAPDNSIRLLLATNNVVLDGLQVREGYGLDLTTHGAGLLINGTNVAVRNSVFTRNYTPGVGSAIYVATAANNTLISNCVFTAQTGSSAVYWTGVKNTLVQNCLFLNNGCTDTLVGSSGSSPWSTARNCTFAGNSGNQLKQQYSSSILYLDNAIVWGNVNTLSANAATLRVSYSDVQYFTGSDVISNVVGNLDQDPLFVGGPSGTWTANAVHDAMTDRTTLTDANAVLVPNALRGRHLNPKSAEKHWYYILSNSTTQMVVLGNASAVGTSGTAYRVDDAHLQSRQGYWTWSGIARSSAQSPCIDAGDPARTEWSREPSPNGERLNMGAYGGTPQASLSIGSGTLFMFR